MDIDAVKSSYARWAPVYDRTFGAITRAGRHATVSHINSQPVNTVLEVGVGTGLALRHYRRDLQVTGIDFSEEMLKKARTRIREERLDYVQQLRQMDARALDFPDNHFDLVTAMHIVSVVPEPEQVVAEMARVCKPGGQIVITNHFARDTGLLAVVEKLSAPFSGLLGWHSDFSISTVLNHPALAVKLRKSLPPMGVMTFLVLEKTMQAVA